MNQYLVTGHNGDMEMADAEMPDAEMADAFIQRFNELAVDGNGSNNRSNNDINRVNCARVLGFQFTARSLAAKGPRFALCFHHLREAFDRDEHRHIEFQLHRLMRLVFELDDRDPANISRDEWANLGFRVERIENLNVEGLPNGFDTTFRSFDGRHGVRVRLPIYAPPRLGDGLEALVVPPAGPAIYIQYTGFLLSARMTTRKEGSEKFSTVSFCPFMSLCALPTLNKHDYTEAQQRPRVFGGAAV
jgi:hypothetical protein